MKLNGSIKQIAAIVGCQIAALGLMVLGAFALARTHGLDDAAALASLGQESAADCSASEEALAGAADLNLDYLDLSVGFRR